MTETRNKRTSQVIAANAPASCDPRLRLLGRVLKAAQIEAAILLVECRSKCYWAEEYSSFTEYVEEEVGIPMRTPQEMIRLIRKCSDAGVPVETVVELGWSKIALVASQLTRENAAELLDEVRLKSYSQLQEIMRQKKRQQKNHHKKGKQPDAQVDQPAPIMLSETVQEALRLACSQSEDRGQPRVHCGKVHGALSTAVTSSEWSQFKLTRTA